jgi:hypothetical protein
MPFPAVPGTARPGGAVPGMPGAAPPAGPSAGPSWLAARTGLPADPAAVNRPAQVTQFLAAHGITAVYAGTQIITPSGNVGYGYGDIDWADLGVSDVDQPFTMPGGETAVGRVTVPLSPAGNGADVTVSLCADSGGSPGTVIASARIPAAWTAQLAAPAGLPAGPLATAQSNTLRLDDVTSVPWASPVTSPGSPALPTVTSSGNYIIQAGGQAGGAEAASAFTVGWDGGTAIGTVLPQPAVPQPTGLGALIATPDTLVLAGGQPTLSTVTADVWAASWAPDTGIAGAWTAQAPLPQALWGAASAVSGGTVYVIGGAHTAAGAPGTSVYYATVSNGQLTGWSAGPPLPAARYDMFAAVVNGWLVAGGGGDLSGYYAGVWYAPLGPDGTPGSWLPGPPLPAASVIQGGCCLAVTDSGIVLFSGSGPLGPVYLAQSLAVTADGPGQWQQQALNPSLIPGVNPGNNPAAAFALTAGTWQLIAIQPGQGTYCTGVLASVPVISVPLPATGLTPGGTYHILVHQDGGDLNDYAQVALDPGALAAAAQARPAGGGPWTGLPGTYSMLAGVFDQTPGGQLLHTWEDGGARITAMVYGSAYGQLLGLCEATTFTDGTMLAAVTQVTYGSTGQPAGLVQLA